jgi:F-type H+-transporting ATPase subunit c
MPTAGIIAIAAAACVLTGTAAGISIGHATAKAAESIARQPEAGSKIQTVTILGAALAEATAIYGFVIALILLLVYKAA